MADEYSLYEAKANLSRIVKQVRESGNSVVVTVHGKPTVEIRAYRELPLDLDARIEEMRARGEIRPAKANPRDYVWTPLKPARRGGLQRFLEDRNR
jgi:prevent-host-death family protein